MSVILKWPVNIRAALRFWNWIFTRRHCLILHIRSPSFGKRVLLIGLAKFWVNFLTVKRRIYELFYDDLGFEKYLCLP